MPDEQLSPFEAINKQFGLEISPPLPATPPPEARPSTPAPVTESPFEAINRQFGLEVSKEAAPVTPPIVKPEAAPAPPPIQPEAAPITTATPLPALGPETETEIPINRPLPGVVPERPVAPPPPEPEAPGEGRYAAYLTPTQQLHAIDRMAANVVRGPGEVLHGVTRALEEVLALPYRAVTGDWERKTPPTLSYLTGKALEYVSPESLKYTENEPVKKFVGDLMGSLAAFAIPGGVARTAAGVPGVVYGGLKATSALEKLAYPMTLLEKFTHNLMTFGTTDVFRTVGQGGGVEEAGEALKRSIPTAALFTVAQAIPFNDLVKNPRLVKALESASTGTAFAGSSVLAGQRDPASLAVDFLTGAGLHLLMSGKGPKPFPPDDYRIFMENWKEENQVDDATMKAVKNILDAIKQIKPKDEQRIYDQFGRPPLSNRDQDLREALQKEPFDRNAYEKFLVDQNRREGREALEPELAQPSPEEVAQYAPTAKEPLEFRARKSFFEEPTVERLQRAVEIAGDSNAAKRLSGYLEANQGDLAYGFRKLSGQGFPEITARIAELTDRLEETGDPNVAKELHNFIASNIGALKGLPRWPTAPRPLGTPAGIITPVGEAKPTPSRVVRGAPLGTGVARIGDDIKPVPTPEVKAKATPESQAVKGGDAWRETALQDLINAPDAHVIEGASHGVIPGRQTRLDKVFDVDFQNQEGEWQDPYNGQRLYDSFENTRQELRNQFGDTIKLYRAEAPKKELIANKHTLNWATEPQAKKFIRWTDAEGKQHTRKLISADIPIEDILAVNVGPSGNYEEFIVFNRKSKGLVLPDQLRKATPTPAETTAEERGGVPGAKEAQPLRYDPSVNRHNGEKLVPGDILTDNEGNTYRLDRDQGYMLTVDQINEAGQPIGIKSFSVDPTDTARYRDLFRTGQNAFEKPTVPEAKEPWEMTRAKYVGEQDWPDLRKFTDRANVIQKDINKRWEELNKSTKFNEYDATEAEREAHIKYVDDLASNDPQYQQLLQDQKRQEDHAAPYRQSSEAWIQRDREHRQAIKEALSQGKPVPPEVLADYPDLAAPEAKEAWEIPAPYRGFANPDKSIEKLEDVTALKTLRDITNNRIEDYETHGIRDLTGLGYLKPKDARIVIGQEYAKLKAIDNRIADLAAKHAQPTTEEKGAVNVREPWLDEEVLKSNLDVLDMGNMDAMAALRDRLGIDHATAMKLRVKIEDYSKLPTKPFVKGEKIKKAARERLKEEIAAEAKRTPDPRTWWNALSPKDRNQTFKDEYGQKIPDEYKGDYDKLGAEQKAEIDGLFELRQGKGAAEEETFGAGVPSWKTLQDTVKKFEDASDELLKIGEQITALEKEEEKLKYSLGTAAVRAEKRAGGRLADGRDYLSLAPKTRERLKQVREEIRELSNKSDQIQKDRFALWEGKDVERWDYDNYISQGKELPPDRIALYPDHPSKPEETQLRARVTKELDEAVANLSTDKITRELGNEGIVREIDTEREHPGEGFSRGWLVTFKDNGLSVRILESEGELVALPGDAEALSRESWRKLGEDPDEFVGRHTPVDMGSVVEVAKDAPPRTIRHELWHFIERWLLTDEEYIAVARAYGENPEARANAYEDWNPRTQPNTIFEKIRDFFRRILDMITGKAAADRIFEMARKGEIYGREAFEREAGAYGKAGERRSLWDNFKTTEDFNRTGFVTPDGKLIDMDPMQHARTIREAGLYPNEPSESMINHFIEDTGAARTTLQYGNANIMLARKPTGEQLSQLKDFMHYGKMIVVDIRNPKTGGASSTFEQGDIQGAVKFINSAKYAEPPESQLAVRRRAEEETDPTRIDQGGFVRALKKPIDYLDDILKGAQRMLAPGAQGKEFKDAAYLVRSHLGTMNRRDYDTSVNVKSGRRMFYKMGVGNPKLPYDLNPGPQFMSDMSTGRPVASGTEDIAAKIRKENEAGVKRLEAVDAPLSNVRENYFGMAWLEESRRAFNQAIGEAIEAGRGVDAEGVLNLNEWQKADKDWVRNRVQELMRSGQGTDEEAAKYLSRRPFRGRESFRHPKVFEDIMTGFEFGLQPVSYNPVDIFQIKTAEMNRSIYAHGIIKDGKEKGDIVFNHVSKKIPEGWALINDRYSTVYGPYDPETGARPIYGHYIAKAPLAEIINNSLSLSFYNNPYFGKAFKSVMATGNMLNQFQLLSGFHVGFTSIETQISAGAEIIKDTVGLLRGERTTADLGRTLAKYPTAMGRFATEGNRVLAEYANPSIDVPLDVPISSLPDTPQYRAALVARAAELVGGGFTMEHKFRTHWSDKMVKEWYGGQKLKAIMRSPIVMTELALKPVMDFLVPRQKAGVFGDLVGRILETNPGKTLNELRPELNEAWNRVDARLGQVRYDRLFMREGAKNAMQASFRAPGWTGGTIMEVGGAQLDLARFMKEWYQTGKAPRDIPDRVAYTMSLLGTMALANGLMTYLFTGERPHGTDWWAFRTGEVDSKGRAVRFLLPSYMKDLFAWYTAPLHTAIAKTHPLWSMVGEIARNKDYYNTLIADPQSPIKQQVLDMGQYLLRQYVPFGVRGMQQVSQYAKFTEEPGRFIAPQFGIMPAPRAYTNTPAQQVIEDYNVFTRSAFSTKEVAAMKQLKSDLAKLAKDGDQTGFETAAREAITTGKLTREQVKSIVEESQAPPGVKRFAALPLQWAARAWNEASDYEKSQWQPYFLKKIMGSKPELLIRNRDALLPILEEMGLPEAVEKLKTLEVPEERMLPDLTGLGIAQRGPVIPDLGLADTAIAEAMEGRRGVAARFRMPTGRPRRNPLAPLGIF